MRGEILGREILKFRSGGILGREILKFRSGGILKPGVLPINFKIPRRENFIS